MEPHPEAVQQLSVKFLQRCTIPIYEKLKELFEERPIWSRSGIKTALRYTSDNIKYLLPTVGYYFTSGPWRNLWIRFGYDPRQKPESFIYQTFNYRLRQSGLIKSYVEAKRSYSSSYALPYKSVNASSKRKVSIIQSDLLKSNKGIKTEPSNSPKASSSKLSVKIEASPSKSSDNDDTCMAKSSSLDDGDEDEVEEDLEFNMDAAEGLEPGEGGEEDSSTIAEENYIYKQGFIPPCRQMVYQVSIAICLGIWICTLYICGNCEKNI